MNKVFERAKTFGIDTKNKVGQAVDTVTDVKNVVTAFKTVKTIKSGIDTVRHPVEWMRDTIKGWVVGAVKAALMLVVKRAIVDHALDRIEGSAYQTQFEIEPPEAVRKYLFTDEGMDFLQTTASMAFNEPLFALGLKLGRIHFEIVDTSKLACIIELRLHSTQSAFNALSYQGVKQ